MSVIGISFGGFTTCALVTQTQIFRAAIAISSVGLDMFSQYANIDPRCRYNPYDAGSRVWPWSVECAQLRLGVPPWKDVDRYVRNSPMLHAENITTPLLLVQGSVDPGIAQAEEFFSVLHRLGKTVEFVRYVGEAHSIESPPNIIDFWNRVYQFLDRHVR